MSDRILWLRISYWTGAVVDALACIPLVNSNVWAALNGVANFRASVEFRYAEAFAATFMAGWTVLLVWADRHPLERRGVLLITVFPVILGLNGARYLLYLGGLVPEAFPPSSLVLPLTLTALFLFSYGNSLRQETA